MSFAGRALRRLGPLLLLTVLLTVGVATAAVAQTPEGPLGPAPVPPPQMPVPPEAPEAPEAPPADGVLISLDSEGGLSQAVTTLIMLTVVAVAPLLLLMMTTFTRFVIILSLVRNGLGLQTVPPAQVLIGLALFLSLFTMGPTLSVVNETALGPFLDGEMDVLAAVGTGYEPLRDFMLAQVREDDLRMFLNLAGQEAPASAAEIGPTTLIPAFIISELRTAFTIGFVIFVPFLVVDLVVAAVLMSLGMVMLPPIFVSLPLKLLLFVLVDGWSLLSRSMVSSVVQAAGGGML